MGKPLKIYLCYSFDNVIRIGPFDVAQDDKRTRETATDIARKILATNDTWKCQHSPKDFIVCNITTLRAKVENWYLSVIA